MSTECNRALVEAERKAEYYKEMYTMRTEAYLKLVGIAEQDKRTIQIILESGNLDIYEQALRAGMA